MACVTDDERRRVAEMLRMSDERDAAGFDCLLAEVVRGREFCEAPCEHCHGRLLDELADLIEPTPKSTDKAPTDSRPNCGTAEVPTSQVPKCDREALLALADEMEFDGAGALDDEDWCKPLLVEYARRIREACGEVES